MNGLPHSVKVSNQGAVKIFNDQHHSGLETKVLESLFILYIIDPSRVYAQVEINNLTLKFKHLHHNQAFRTHQDHT